MSHTRTNAPVILDRPPSPVAHQLLDKTDEVVELATRFADAHSKDAALMASLWHLSFTLLTDFGARYGTNPAPLVDLLRKALHQQAILMGFGAEAVHKALLALQQAGETAQILDSLPD